MRRVIVGLAALALSGCFDFDALRQPLDGSANGGDDMSLGGGDDMTGAPADFAGTDGGGVLTPTPRLIAQAWWTNQTGFTYASPGMIKTGFSIPTTGIVNGDLVLFIANIDNGSDTLWPTPIAPGFTPIIQKYFGSDGQTFIAAWKIANNEPSTYTGTYGQGNGSGSSVIALIAVSGANSAMPIDHALGSYSMAGGTDPVNGSSPGFTTTAANCTLILAGGVDWLGTNDANTYTLPNGFTFLSQIGDHASLSPPLNWDWTSQFVSWSTRTTPGATGAINWTANGTNTVMGIPWTVLIAVAP